MRSILLIVLLFICLIPEGKTQLLTVTPSFPKDTSALSIIADCSKGNQGLFNYANSNDVYVHVGVITNLSTSATDWKYVKFTWPGTDPASKATSLGNNKYQYTISHIRNFFGVPANEQILKVTVLFRNGAGTSVQRNTDGTDMYVPVYTDVLAGRYILPPLQPKFVPVAEPINKFIGDTVRVNWLTNKLADLKITFNGVQSSIALSSNLIVDSLVVTSSGSQTIVASATIGAT